MAEILQAEADASAVQNDVTMRKKRKKPGNEAVSSTACAICFTNFAPSHGMFFSTYCLTLSHQDHADCIARHSAAQRELVFHGRRRVGAAGSAFFEAHRRGDNCRALTARHSSCWAAVCRQSFLCLSSALALRASCQSTRTACLCAGVVLTRGYPMPPPPLPGQKRELGSGWLPGGGAAAAGPFQTVAAAAAAANTASAAHAAASTASASASTASTGCAFMALGGGGAGSGYAPGGGTFPEPSRPQSKRWRTLACLFPCARGAASIFPLENDSLLAVSCLSQLQSLHLANAPSVTQAALLTAFGHCPLRSVNLAGCWQSVDDALLAGLAERCHRTLARLQLAHCTRVRGPGLLACAEACRGLQELTLKGRSSEGRDKGGTGRRRSCGDVDGETDALCERLRAALLTPPAAQALVRRPAGAGANTAALPQGRVGGVGGVGGGGGGVGGGGVGGVGGVGVDIGVGVGVGGCRLQRVDISWSSRLGDAGVQALAAACPSLRSLSVSRCGLVQDAGVCAAVRLCPLLQELLVAFCPLVTDALLRELRTEGAAPALRVLDVEWCTSITRPGLQAFMRARKGVRVPVDTTFKHLPPI
jgi:hypothetical protein